MSSQEEISNKSLSKLELFYSISSWVFAILFFLLGIIIVTSNSVSGLILFIAGLYLLPPINIIVASRAKFKITPIISVAVATLLFLGSALNAGINSKTAPITEVASNSLPSQNQTSSAEQAKNDQLKKNADIIQKSIDDKAKADAVAKAKQDQAIIDKAKADAEQKAKDEQIKVEKDKADAAAKLEAANKMTDEITNNINLSNSDITVTIQNKNKKSITISYININEEAWNKDNYYTSTFKSFELGSGESKTLKLNSFVDYTTETNRFNPYAQVANSFHVVGFYSDGDTKHDIDSTYR